MLVFARYESAVNLEHMEAKTRSAQEIQKDINNVLAEVQAMSARIETILGELS